MASDGGGVTKRKVTSPEEILGSENLSGRRKFGAQFKVTSPASDSTSTKTSEFSRGAHRLQRNVTGIVITTPVSDFAAAKIVDPQSPSGRSKSKQMLQRNATSPASSVTGISSPVSNASEIISPASNGRGSEDYPSRWKKRFSPRLQNIPLVKRPFYGSTPRAFKKKRVCNQKEISGGSISNSGTTSLRLSSSDNEGHDHCLNDELKASNSIKVQTSTCDQNLKIKRCSPRLQNILQRPFYGSSPRAFEKKRVCNQKEISGSSMCNSGTASLHLSSSDNEGHDHCLNAELKASNSMKVETSTWDQNCKVTESWACNGVSGFHGYNYKLRCLEEQPKSTNNQVPFNHGKMMKISSGSPGVICTDISAGQEELCIPAINTIDDVPFAPPGFTYTKSIQVAENVDIPPNADGCNCKGNCVNPKTCACAKLNGSRFPYVRHSGGRLIRARNVVFECGPNCGCGPDCKNRLSQRGIKYHLEVFRTQNKGWAVRTLDFIPSGAPVCEYVGLLKRSKDLDSADDNEYIFEIDCLHTIKGVEGRERRLGAVSGPLRNHLEEIDDGYFDKTPEFCVDANSVGNVARFINHSCEPNLFIQCVLSAHHDARLARIVLFASENIPPSQELTYDYGCPLDSVIGSDGKVIQLPCHCGTPDCRKRVY